VHRDRHVGECGADIGDHLGAVRLCFGPASVWGPRRPGQREMRPRAVASTSIIRWLAYKKVSSDSQVADRGGRSGRQDGG
jgi:hypothetical protein